MNFTFVFVTKGRKNFDKSLKNCLTLSMKYDYIKTIIVDGNNDNRVNIFLEKKFPNLKIKVFKQSKGRFVRACLIGLENIESNFFTFMHDDDYISPYFVNLIQFAIKNNTAVIANYLIYKNIGQDILLYLISLKIQKQIFYCNEYTCQFSSHDESMSVNFGTHNLGVGYWLAKKYFSRFEGSIFDKKLSFEEKLNLFIRGIIYCLKQGLSNNKFYFHSTRKLLKEIINTKKIEINNL